MRVSGRHNVLTAQDRRKRHYQMCGCAETLFLETVGAIGEDPSHEHHEAVMYLKPQALIHLNVEMRRRKKEEVKKSKSSPPDALATGLTRLDKAGDTSVTCFVHFASPPPRQCKGLAFVRDVLDHSCLLNVPAQQDFDLSNLINVNVSANLQRTSSDMISR